MSEHDDHHHGHHQPSALEEGVETMIGQLGDTAHHNMMMSMSFHAGVNEVILFDFWKTNCIYGILLSCAIIFVICLLYEGVKATRRFIYEHRIQHHHYPNESANVATTANSATDANGSSISPLLVRFTRSSGPYMSSDRFINSILYGIQGLLAYTLMLIAMTFNVYLFAAVIVGEMIGYYLFTGVPKKDDHLNDCCG